MSQTRGRIPFVYPYVDDEGIESKDVRAAKRESF